MIINETPRPTEHLHSVKCLASAIIAAVENYRDTEHMTDIEFRLHAQDGTFLRAADEYLAEGLMNCRCGPCSCTPTCRELAQA